MLNICRLVYILSEIPLYIWSCDQWDREIKVSVLAVGLPVPLLWAGLCFIFWTFRLICCCSGWVVCAIMVVISVAWSITTNTLQYTILPTKWPNHCFYKQIQKETPESSSKYEARKYYPDPPYKSNFTIKATISTYKMQRDCMRHGSKLDRTQAKITKNQKPIMLSIFCKPTKITASASILVIN